jgi:glycosyltransferase involved in cell wall biosynthesis
MNIKVLVCMFGKGNGGLERVFVDYVRAMHDCGFDLYAACHSKSPMLAKSAQIIPEKILKLSHTVIYNPLLFCKILRFVNKIKPDIILLHGNRAVSIFTSPIIKKFLQPDVKICATTHNYRNKRFTRLDASLAISKDLMLDLEKRGISKERIFYCPNSVELTDFRFKPFSSPPVIGVLGRLHPVKGYDILLKACAALKSKNINFNLTIAGNGDELDNLTELSRTLGIEQQTKFIGWIDDIDKFFAETDIFCMPSRSEGLPISLLQALSHSKPCVITDIPGPSEILSTYNAGLIVEKEDPAQLADALERILSDEKLAEGFALKGWQTVRDNYSFEMQKERLADICRSVVRL